MLQENGDRRRAVGGPERPAIFPVNTHFMRYIFSVGLLFSCLVAGAQFFAKVDEDFKFNGISLRVESGLESRQTKGCKMIEETESYRIWQPEDQSVKGKGFTLHDILYITDFENSIVQIRARNWDPKEKEKILTDMRKKARQTGTMGDVLNPHYFFKQENRTTTYYKRTPGNDTVTVFIVLDYFLSRNQDYREHHDYFPFIGKNIRSDELRDFLFAYGPPESRSGFTGSDGVRTTYLIYYGYGMELFIHGDILKQVTVYSKTRKFSPFKGALPYGLKIGDTRKNIQSRLGIPDSRSRDGSTWYYTRGDKQVRILFSMFDTKELEDDPLTELVVAQK